MLSLENWNQFGKVCAVVGLMCTAIGATLPDPYGKLIMGISAGLANVAAFLGIKGIEKAS